MKLKVTIVIPVIRIRLSIRMFSATKRILTTCALQRNHHGQRLVAQLAGRAHLPGSDGKDFPKVLAEARNDFPMTIDCEFVSSNENASAFAKCFFASLQHSIHKFGAVLLKNLPLKTGDEFSGFVHDGGLKAMNYVGGSGVRDLVAQSVSTASREPPIFTIEPHNEMAYLPYWPHLFVVFCDIPATEGGESGLTDVRDILRDLDPNVVDKFHRLGICYHRYLPDAKANDYTSWQESLMCDNKDEAERILSESGQYFKWNEDGSLCFWKTLSAFAPHYITGEMLWFNQCHSQNASYFKAHPDFCDKDLPDDRYPFHTYYGDGSDIEPDVLQQVREVTWKNTVGLRLDKSDVLIFDNMLIQHSRLSFRGDRKLLVSIANFY
ncbi:dapdiamide synthesis protein DdaC-like [Tubulanus polymorphus]|uniref:dapdiamide synthesis protein DdaC-like n=1 Tax=Tubulanus polymorphus TaxID=672921 RepID=UPI003DA2A425